jgi:CheY-like chemotaxis protein
LVVDDDPHARASLGILVRPQGFAVAEVGDGREALEWLETHPPPALILLDLCLGGLDGWDVLARLSADGRLAVIPVAVVSGLACCARLGSLRGAAVILHKPVTPEALAQICRWLPVAPPEEMASEPNVEW